MTKARWIWYPGDFEIYHHLILSCRRQELGCDYPCMWHLARPEASVRFKKTFTAERSGVIRVLIRGRGMVRLQGKLFPAGSDIPVPAGAHEITVEADNLTTFPAIYIESDLLVTDGSWEADSFDSVFLPAGCEPGFFSPGDDPAVFPFLYEDLSPVSSEETAGGVLYDFGRETFGPVTLSSWGRSRAILAYGESREEVLDHEHTIVRETVSFEGRSVRPSRAFRYLFLRKEEGEPVSLSARYEYLPLEDKASFSADDPLIKRIWDTAAYTFHLNSREFFLDGVKRDRWVWSGDAYQSYMIARYLYNDPSVTRRTIVALLGKPPYRNHVNTINDYSAYVILSVLEEYEAGGDEAFLRMVWPRVKELFAFITGRLDERGYVTARPGDWIFIDWGELDKDGPHCVEQILLWRVYLAMGKLSRILGEEDKTSCRASALKDAILRDYFDSEKGAFVDSFTSGRRFVTRQTNAFAVLFDLAEGEVRRKVIENALLNPALPPITTPYFKLFELLTLAKIGRIEEVEEFIASYWGGILGEGATTVWETYDPRESGAAHYAMYGMKYGKSLCHAWGSGPILLLSRFVAGVEPTSPGAKTFRVEPRPGKYGSFEAVIPVGTGRVKLSWRRPEITVETDAPGGVFVRNGSETPLEPGKKYVFPL